MLYTYSHRVIITKVTTVIKYYGTLTSHVKIESIQHFNGSEEKCDPHKIQRNKVIHKISTFFNDHFITYLYQNTTVYVIAEIRKEYYIKSTQNVT